MLSRHAVFALIGLIFLVQSPVSAAVVDAQCMGFFALDFSFSNFSMYDTYFHNQSQMVFGYAGTYTGPEAIAEYVGFMTPGSPYVESYYDGGEAIFLQGVDGDQCVFLYELGRTYVNQPELMSDPYTIAVATKLRYSPLTNKVDHIAVHYDDPAVKHVFANFANNHGREYVCGVMKNTCPGTWTLNNLDTIQECVDTLAALPVIADTGHFDGNSQACRYMHAAFAQENDDHCAHISFVSQEDPDGKIKCQTSAGMSGWEDFGSADPWNFYLFKQGVGIDVNNGYQLNRCFNMDCGVGTCSGGATEDSPAICTCPEGYSGWNCETSEGDAATTLLIAGLVFIGWVLFVFMVIGLCLYKNANIFQGTHTLVQISDENKA